MTIFAAKSQENRLETAKNGSKITNNVHIMYHLSKIIRDIERPFQPRRAEWVQVAGLALGAASSILGGVSSAAAARRAEQLRKEQDARNAAWFARKYNESYIDTAAGRNAIRQATDYARTMTKRAEGAAAVTGGTDAAVAQAKEGANKMVGDSIGQLAAQDTARKESAEATYMQQQEQSTAWQMANQQQRAQGIAQAAAGASNALIQGAAMLGSTGGNVDVGNRLNAVTDGQSAGAYAGKNAMSVSPSSPQLSSGVPTMAQYTKKYGAPIGRHGLTQ